MEYLVITNNPEVLKRLPHLEVVCIEGSVLDLYTRVRDYVHQGHRLLTHPLSGSLKPGKIPYKSVVLAGDRQNLDLQSLQLIESSIEVCRDSISRVQQIIGDGIDGILEDYATVDLSHLQAALESLESQYVQ